MPKQTSGDQVGAGEHLLAFTSELWALPDQLPRTPASVPPSAHTKPMAEDPVATTAALLEGMHISGRHARTFCKVS